MYPFLKLKRTTEPIVFYTLKSTLFLARKGILAKLILEEKYWETLIIINDNLISFYYLFQPRLNKDNLGSEINGIELMSLNFKNNKHQNINWEEDAVLVFIGVQENCPNNIDCMQVINTKKILSSNVLMQKLYNFCINFRKVEKNIFVLSNNRNDVLGK